MEQVVKERYYTSCTVLFLIHDTKVLGKHWIYLFVTHSALPMQRILVLRDWVGVQNHLVISHFVYLCRDQLKLQLDNQQSSGEALNIDAGLFRFRSKTLATVATNNRLTSGDIVTANTTQNGNSLPRQGMCTT